MPTPLARQLRDPAPARAAGPLDAFRLARRAFMAGERIDMGAIATELGVNRATLYRWVGSKELLLGEVISAFARETLRRADEEVPGRGPRHVAEVVVRVLDQIHTFAPMRAFLERDPQYALRVLTSVESIVQLSAVEAMHEVLVANEIESEADLADLAYVVVRIGESFLYSDLLIGAEPNVAKAGLMVRILLGG